MKRVPVEGPLSGRIALVTGASRGIGEAIARRFAIAGAAVAVTARTVEEGDHPLPGGLTTTVEAIRAIGGIALAVPGDLSKPEERERIVSAVNEELGRIDILVNNAAITYFAPVEGFDAKRFGLMFEVQVTAPVHLAQLVIADMRSAGAGWILNISSPAAIRPSGPPYVVRGGGGTVYGMCKAALERFTSGLASELYPDNIAVNSLAPSGLVVTPGVQHHGLDRLIPADRHEPIGLMAEAAYLLCCGSPQELTGRIAYTQPLLEELGAEPLLAESP